MTGYDEKIIASIKEYKEKEHPVDNIAYKLKAYSLAAEQGIQHAKIYGIFSRIEFVPWEKLPGQFVIKPQHGCSEKGVFPLVKLPDGKYQDILRNKTMSLKEIIAAYMEGLLPESHVKHSRGLWIEELLSNPIPFDWKVFAFNGKAEMIRQYKRDGKKKICKFWDREWNNIEKIHKKIYSYEIDNSLPSPKNGPEIIRVAEKISKALNYPFARIDLYETQKGIFIGEVTAHPGRDIRYTDYWDKRLGECWERAEEEIRGGRK